MISGIIQSGFYNYKKIKLILHNKINLVIFILSYKFDFKILFGLVECTLLRILICSKDAGMKGVDAFTLFMILISYDLHVKENNLSYYFIIYCKQSQR